MDIKPDSFEKLGVFYLGREYDLDRGQPRDKLLLYDSKDLLTHAVCVGMTGSGKTGLCLTLLEEAAIDGIPAIVIDPKGDLTNLLLTFPQLRPEDFQPWVHEDDARRQNVSTEEFAKQQAELWKKGLAEWGQDGDRIARLRAAADFAIYTPGSSAGRRVSVLQAFAAPAQSIRDDADLLRERVNATVTGLLTLVGLTVDPLTGREHILLATILETAWRAGRNLDLSALIEQTQKPPVTKIGVVDLESFFPAKERFALAMKLNNLLSAPGFAAWLEGEPLDVGALLHSSTGKPRVSIFSIAHLDDSQRMFFVALLLNEMLSWMRTQSGATSLRAMLFMDEIFGYFPPVANPPTKLPLLTLLKQARAFGLGIVLATQNPVDLDYKGLANAGTWFLGRLQTERDKARVIEGLQGAAASAGAQFDKQAIMQMLSGLKNRIFLMNNVHEDAPVVFQARWAMSYLCGPLARDQIKRLCDEQQPAASAGGSNNVHAASGAAAGSSSSASVNSASTATSTSSATDVGDLSLQPPLVPPQIPQFFVPLRGTSPAGAKLVYQPAVLGLATVHYTDKKLAIDAQRPICWLANFHATTGAIDWTTAAPAQLTDDDLEKQPAGQSLFASLPAEGSNAKAVTGWQKAFADAVYRLAKLDLMKSAALDEVSKPEESERDFRIRLQQAAREQRDALLAKLREKYAPKQAQLEDRIRKAEQKVSREKSEARAEGWQTVISFGATLLDMVLGRKRLSATTVRKAQTAARGVGRSMKQSADVTEAEESVESLQAQQAQLEQEVQAETAAAQTKLDPLTETFEVVSLRPKKVDIAVRLTALAWLPQWQDASGTNKPGWQ
ncbi:MAG TPA: ATP-binding protein [Pirellulales bacterium]|jgi:hypothetical protein